MGFAIEHLDTAQLPLWLGQLKKLKARDATERFAWAVEIVGADVHVVRGERRLKTDVAQRWAIFWLLHNCGWSYPQIGRAMNRDHTTICYGVNRVKDALDKQNMRGAA